jgi:multicomponent Na+:H+ antiporter subunit G
MNELRDGATFFFIFLGAFFAVFAAFGVVRLPDVYMRMQATTKATTLGVGLIMVASAIHFGETGAVTKAVLTVLFFFVTQPIAAHMISRAAYVSKVPQWDRARADDLKGHYDKDTGSLGSEDVEDPDQVQ